MGLMGLMSFTIYNDTRRIIMYDELLYCIVSKYLYIRYEYTVVVVVVVSHIQRSRF